MTTADIGVVAFPGTLPSGYSLCVKGSQQSDPDVINIFLLISTEHEISTDHKN